MKIFVLSLLILFSIVTYAQVDKDLDSLVHTTKYKNFSGNILYSKNDTILYKGNFGYANISEKRRFNDSTLLDIGSLTKQITALAIVQLIEKGHFTYKSKVKDILHNFPYSQITVEHLLRHQSGLIDYMRLMDKHWNKSLIANNENVIDILINKSPPLNFKPGTKYEYSNTGYIILALIIEESSGLSFQEYLKQNIFLPAKMNCSLIYHRRKSGIKKNNVAEGYVFCKSIDEYIIADRDENHNYLIYLDGIVGDGLVYSNILDLEKWKQALRYNTLISKESKGMMFKPDKISKKYGYGFKISNHPMLGRVIMHTGGWSGFFSVNLYVPNTNEYFVILSNNEFSYLGDLLNKIIQITRGID